MVGLHDFSKGGVANGWCVSRCLGVVIAALLLAHPAHADPRFVAPAHTPLEAGWHFHAHRSSQRRNAPAEVCVLRREVDHFGAVKFVGAPGEMLRFVVEPHRDLFASGAVATSVSAPVWHPDYPHEETRPPLPHVDRGRASAGDPQATQLLMDLYAGYELHIRQVPWYAEQRPERLAFTGSSQRAPAVAGSAVAVSVSAVHYRGAYRQFASCVASLLPTSFAAVERSRLTFLTDQHRLSAPALERLRLVARYVLADPEVAEVFVDGHADASGAPAHNLKLSEQRALAVQRFLVRAGVSRSKLRLRFHGARYPVASNETAQGRSANRRTTVRLTRSGESLVAQHQP